MTRRILVFGVAGISIIAVALALAGQMGGQANGAAVAGNALLDGGGSPQPSAGNGGSSTGANNSPGGQTAADNIADGGTCPIGEECNGTSDAPDGADLGNSTDGPADGKPGDSAGGTNGDPVYDNTLTLFWAVGCPECASAKEFLGEMLKEYPSLKIIKHEVNENATGEALMVAFCTENGIIPTYVPIISVGGKVFTKFRDADGPLALYDETGAYFGYRNQIAEAIRDAVNAGASGGGSPRGTALGGLILTAKTDKPLYYSKDPIRVTATITSDRRLSRYYLKVAGSGDLADYVQGSRWLAHIEPGTTEEVFDMKMPMCFGCADFQPGGYKISVWLETDQTEVKSVILDVDIRDIAV